MGYMSISENEALIADIMAQLKTYLLVKIVIKQAEIDKLISYDCNAYLMGQGYIEALREVINKLEGGE